VKVCCIASIEEAMMAIDVGADALGLVAAMPSGPGPIADGLIREIAAMVPPPVSTFLLTSEVTAEAIAAHVQATQPATVQIVAHIDARQSAEMARLLPSTRRVQVIHVEGPETLVRIEAYAPHVHAFLLDSGRPNAAVPELGGTGRAHDWEISAAFDRASPLPVFLAGGLHSGNVADAILAVKPFGVDVCSGVRTNGKLDSGKLAAFLAAVREADCRGRK
jgi:phosphoribosylanthranilate isomerase